MEQQELVNDFEGDEQQQLLDRELLDEDGEDQQLDISLDELHALLQLNELQLKLELCLLLEQQGLKHDKDGELVDELVEAELLDGQLEEKLQERLLDEQLILLELMEVQLKLEVCILEELQRLSKDEDGLLLEKLVDWLLHERELQERLLHISLEQLLVLLELHEIQLKLELCLLLEQHGLSKDEDGELQERLVDLEHFDGELEEPLLDSLLEEIQLLLLL